MQTHSLQLKKPLAFFDLETTGVHTQRDRIVEISIAKAMPNGEVQVKTRRINPEIPIPLEASLIHGIYDEDIKDCPPFKQIARSLVQFIDDADLAGFNSNRFDIPLLVEEFLRVGVDFDTKNRRTIDVQRIFHMMEPRNLSAAYKFYCNKKLEGAHGAEADTLATAEILMAQIARYDGVEIISDKGEISVPIRHDMDILNALTQSNFADLAGRMVYNAKRQEVFNFGKHAGKVVAELLAKEPSYYDWMMNGEFALDTKRKLTEIRLRALQK